VRNSQLVLRLYFARYISRYFALSLCMASTIRLSQVKGDQTESGSCQQFGLKSVNSTLLEQERNKIMCLNILFASSICLFPLPYLYGLWIYGLMCIPHNHDALDM
jgi:hypothetical protein